MPANPATGWAFVRHQANALSGGQVTDMELGEFLSGERHPEHEALLRPDRLRHPRSGERRCGQRALGLERIARYWGDVCCALGGIERVVILSPYRRRQSRGCGHSASKAARLYNLREIKVLSQQSATRRLGFLWRAFVGRACRLWLHIVGGRTAVTKGEEEGNDLQKILDVAESIKQNLIKAIAAEQVVRPAASDNGLIGCFNLGYASNAFELVRHSLLFDQIMALTRIWDTTTNVHSIKELVRLFRDGNLVEKLVERERRASHDIIRAETTLGERTQEVPFSADRATPELREQQLRSRLRALLIARLG